MFAQRLVALEILVMLLQFPKSDIPGLQRPKDDALREADAASQSTIPALDVFASNPDSVSKIGKIWKKLDDEIFSHVA